MNDDRQEPSTNSSKVADAMISGTQSSFILPDSILQKWQHLVDLMAEIVGVPAGLIMRLVEEDIQVLVASRTEGNPYHPGHSEKLFGSDLYCEAVIKNRSELLVPDAFASERWKDNPDTKLNMISYLGFPVQWPDGSPFGTICVLDSKQNAYSEKYKRLIAEFRDMVEGHLQILHSEFLKMTTKANTRFDRLLAVLPHLVYESRISPDGSRSISYLNEKGASLFELDPNSSHLADDFGELIHPEDREWVRKSIWAQLHTSDPKYHRQYRLRLSKGGLRWVDSRGESERQEDGAVLSRGALTDITSLKEAEEALKRAERLAGIGSWSWNAEENRSAWSDALFEMFHLDLSEPAPDLSDLERIFTPESAAMARATIEQCSISGEPYSVDLEGIRPDGRHFFVTARGDAARDADGKIVGQFGTVQDITERRAIETHIQELNKRLELAIRAGAVGIWEANLGSGEYLLNSQMHEIYEIGHDGYRANIPPNTFGGSMEEWLAVIHPEDVAEVKQVLERARNELSSVSYEYRILRPSGEIRYLRDSAQIFRDTHGHPVRAVGTTLDITEEKKAVDALQQAEKLAAVGRLASSVAHEINNPLQSVTNLLYIAGARAEEDPLSPVIQQAQEELARVSQIVTQTLRFHRQSENPMPTRLVELVDSVLPLFRSRLDRAAATMIVDDRQTRTLICYQSDMRQVIANLIGNAIDAINGWSDARVVVRIRDATDCNTPRAGIRLTVADNGAGMDIETHTRLFEPFFSTKGARATGLGLWVSKEILNKHNASLKAKSSQRSNLHGTVFSIFLPALVSKVRKVETKP